MLMGFVQSWKWKSFCFTMWGGFVLPFCNQEGLVQMEEYGNSVFCRVGVLFDDV